MSVVVQPETWTEQAENRWRWVLESAHMKFSYRRPRTMVARHAMYRAITELIDARLASLTMTRFLWETLRPFDFSMILGQPAQRPRECLPMLELNTYREPEEDWNDGEVCRSALKQRRMTSIGARHVLAERTVLRLLSRDEPEEWIESGLVTQSTSPVLGAEPWENLRMTHPHSHYSNLPSLAKPENLLVKGDTYDLESPGFDWIAIKPTVAEVLGWHLSEDGFFRWRDACGTLMVESIWWTDGSVQHHSSRRDVEVGEGWAVVCSVLDSRRFFAVSDRCSGHRDFVVLRGRKPNMPALMLRPLNQLGAAIEPVARLNQP